MHDSIIGAHVGKSKMYLAVSDCFYWPKMRGTVEKYTVSCDACQRTKPSRQLPGGLLHPMPVPVQRWEYVTLDFLTKLPLTKRGHTAIMAVMCKLSKRAIFVPTTDEADAPQTAHLFFKHVFRHHGLPKVLISDRDPKFTSKFWTSLFKLMGTKLNMSTADHPQTDGQSEHTIQTLEQYLQVSVNYLQNDWNDHLTTLEFAFNNSVSTVTNMIPFELDSGCKPFVPMDLLSPVKDISISKLEEAATAPALEEFFTTVHSNLHFAQEQIKEAQDIQKAYADKKRRLLTFAVGDKVMLPTGFFTKDNNSTRPNAALRQRYMGPFRVIAVRTPTVYKLEFPKGVRAHPVVHVSVMISYQDPAMVD